MAAFLDKHFNRSLSEEEREAIMQDFPKPNCDVLVTPPIDKEVKEQLKGKGKDAHWGAEKPIQNPGATSGCQWPSDMPVGRPDEKRSLPFCRRCTLDSPACLGALRQCLTCNLIGAQANCMGKTESEVENPRNREL